VKKILKQKKILFPFIFLVELAILIAIAIIFNLETDNSLYGAVFAFVIWGTFLWFLIKIVKDHKTKLSTVKIPLFGISSTWLFYLAIAAIITSTVSVALVALFGNN